MVIPKISVVIPCFNRKDELLFLIHSLNEQSVDKNIFEVIISDDGSTDGTDLLVKDWATKVEYNLNYIAQQNQGPGAARNHGVSKANGELILFIDSDCEAHPEWIKNIWEEYNKNGFDACGGPDGAKEDFTSLQKAIDYSMTSFLTTGGMRGHSEKMVAKFYPRTHNMGATKEICEKAGGFGNLRHGQDIEFSFRIKKAGGKIRFIKDALVYHRRRTSFKQFFKQVFNWGVARINLGKVSPELLEPVHFLPAVATIIGMAILMGAILGFALFKFLLLIALISLILFAFSGAIYSRSLITGYLLFFVTPIQVFGYGFGFIYGFIKRFIGSSGQITGFKKNYYK